VDALLVVVNESPLSFGCAEKVKDIVGDMKGRIRKTYVVTSMVNEKRLDEVHKRIETLGMELLADIPKNEEIEDLTFDGRPMNELKADSVLSIIDGIIEKIGGENETA
jgi:CO dehydrogenase nickel-insertion accessory protein CooC1